MGMLKRQQEEKRTKSSKKRQFGVGRGPSKAADWGQVKDAEIKKVIVAVTRAGGALRFGYTADMGAYALGVYGDGDTPYTEYIRPGENVEEILDELAQTFYDIATDEETVA